MKDTFGFQIVLDHFATKMMEVGVCRDEFFHPIIVAVQLDGNAIAQTKPLDNTDYLFIKHGAAELADFVSKAVKVLNFDSAPGSVRHCVAVFRMGRMQMYEKDDNEAIEDRAAIMVNIYSASGEAHGHIDFGHDGKITSGCLFDTDTAEVFSIPEPVPEGFDVWGGKEPKGSSKYGKA